MKRLFAALVLCFALNGIAHAQFQPIPLQGCGPVGSCQLAGNVFSGVTVSWQSATTARYLMIFDATSAPSNGSTTLCSTTQSNGCLSYCAFMPTSATAPSVFSLDWTLHPVQERNGVYIAISTGAGCGTLTLDGSNDYLFSQVR